MAGRIEHLGAEVADVEALAVLEKVIEVAPVRRQVRRIEDRPEDALNILDVLADTDPRAGPGLDIGRAREVIGMRVGLERPLDRVAGLVG